jgi:hypothetical protein
MPNCKRQHHSFERRESERVVINLLVCISSADSFIGTEIFSDQKIVIGKAL